MRADLKSRLLPGVVLLLCAVAPAVKAAPPIVAPPTVAIGTADSPIVLNGRLDEPVWRQAGVIALQANVAKLERREAAQPVATMAPAQTDADSGRLDALEKLIDNTSVGGKIYVDFTNVDQTRDGARTDASGTGLDVKRFYLSIDHKFNDIWSAHLTTDFTYESNDGATQLFVKKAYVQGAFNDLATLRVGVASTPWIPFVEDWYGYRFVEKVLVDRTKFGTSADWGLHLMGERGVFDYQVSAVNGAGYRNPSRSTHVDFAARVGAQPVKGLVFAIGAYDGDLGKDTASSPVLRSARRYDALAGWHRAGLRLGAEWFQADNWNNVTAPLADSADGWSLWGSYDFEPASVFARYDRLNPSKQLDPSLEDTYWNAGVAFPITRGVQVALAYKHERLSNDTNIDMETREIGAWGEIRW